MVEKMNRVALVVGASGEIGRSVALRLAADGIYVIASAHRHPESAQALVDEIRSRGGKAEPVKLDITHPDQTDAVCEAIFDRCGRLDILVGCVAVNREAPALSMEDEAWGEVLETNLTGAYRLSRAAGKYMVLGRWGRIVHISSIAGSFGGRGQINYAASKAGLESMTRVLALELGRKGVLVNCVAPGVIETAMSERIRREHGDALLEQIAARRFGRPEDVANAIAFLVSEAADYVTGQTIRIDGGMGL